MGVLIFLAPECLRTNDVRSMSFSSAIAVLGSRALDAARVSAMGSADKRADIQRAREALKRLQQNASSAQNAATDEPSAAIASLPVIDSPHGEPIAIIGLHGTLPAAASICEFHAYLDEDRAVITEIPRDRFDVDAFYDETGRDPAKMCTRWGGFVPSIRDFDPAFFGFLPRDAELLDPQLRLLLMSVYRAVEDAGHAPSSLRRTRTGVFVAVEDNEYLSHLRAANADLGVNGFNVQPSMVANRISYFLDLRGPSEIVNTMCASAAVALHRAAAALRSGEIEAAIVGAARVIVRPEPLIGLSRLRVLSPTSSVKSFGDGANGYVRAEGVASVVLKPLSAAVQDRDHVYALIRSTAVGFNGQGGMSIAAPNVESHTDVIKRCYEAAGVDVRGIEYIEAQGMGNPIGDLAEWEACNRAIESLCSERGTTYRPGACRIGTLKPMIGHMECASALGALFKIIRSFQTDRIHKIIGLEKINPYLRTDGRPCRLATETEPWPRGERPRLAGLHSYGSGGSHAHILIEEHPGDPRAPSTAGERHVLVLSGTTRAELDEHVRALRDHLACDGGDDLRDIAYTLQVGRDAFTHRAAFVVTSSAEFLARADAFLAAGSAPGVLVGVAERAPHGAVAPATQPVDHDAIAAAWVRGQPVAWAAVHVGATPRRISLPTHVFRTMPCWFGSAPSRRGKRVCVIGAGPGGLVMAKSLREEGHEAVVLEKQASLGGLWVLHRDKTAGAYRRTRFQSSKFTSVFSDLYLDDIASTFYSVDDIQRYLAAYAEAFGLAELIRYNTEVVAVREVEGRWQVTSRRDGEEVTELFDGVALCQGSFWDPYIPPKDGLAEFRGRVMHSGQYFDNTGFAGQRVLVIGSGVSAMDIAEEVSEVAAAVYWSRRTRKLVLPRMVGFVPNDCQSPASLLVANNRYNLIERLQRSAPEYFELYRRAGILPSQAEFEANPVVHINDGIVKLVAEQRVQAVGDAIRFGPHGCVFDGPDRSEREIDAVVFATGYRNLGSDDARYHFLEGIAPADDFAMGIFYARNPTLVNTSVLPIAFTGSFYFLEMVARWYAQVMSGSYALSADELAHRITRDHYLIMAPISSVLFGLKLGLFPRPETEFREFWRLLNYPAFPMIYRLRGPHAKPEARALLERFRAMSFVKTEHSDPDLRTLKHRLLAGLGRASLERLVQTDEISRDDYEAALRHEGDPFVLTWDAQYITRTAPAAPADAHAPGPRDVAARADAGRWLAAQLAELAAATLRIERRAVDLDRPLSDYGFDSITLTGLAGEITRRLPFVRLDPTTFLEHSTLGALAGHLARTYAAQLAAHRAPGASGPVCEQPREALPSQPRADAPPARPPSPAPVLAAGPRRTRGAASPEPVAVIGLAGRFPGANSVAALWSNLIEGRCALVEVPPSRWRWQDHHGDPAIDRDRTDCHRGGFVSDIECFDPLHFDISPREARFMDPQHRLLLEVAWEAMESAGYPRSRLHGAAVGLFVGVEKQDYLEIIKASGCALDGYINTGNAHSMLANRVSRYFGWRGPSMVVDTACSGSFAALAIAFDQLRSAAIDLAFVGGVNVLLTPSLFILNRKLGMLTSEPVVRPFDRRASGHLAGEGVALVALKRLSDAVRDGDTIYGVIRGVAIEHGGRAVYLTAPNPVAHREVIARALAQAELRPDDIDYIEAQGTGNPLTDTLELRTYRAVFAGEGRRALRVGSIKGNVGHLGAASGVVGLIKTVLALRNRELPAIAGLEQPGWDDREGPLSLDLVDRALEWPEHHRDGRRVPRRAGIHNYGYGGLNAHAIVEEYIVPSHGEAGAAPARQLVVLSARTAGQLGALARDLRDFLERRDWRAWGFTEVTLEEVACALQRGREPLPHRLAWIASSLDALVAELADCAAQPEAFAARPGVFRAVVDPVRQNDWRAIVGKDGSAFIIGRSIAERDLERLASLWVHGFDLPWDELHAGRSIRRIPLPRYPFLREPYWITERGDAQPATEPAPRPSGDEPAVDRDLHAVVASVIGALTDAPAAAVTPSTELAALGFDSLLTARLVDDIERELAIRIELAELSPGISVGGLVEIVRAAPARQRAGRALPREVELLQRGDTSAPVFWFHGALGTVQMYAPLARQLDDVQFYGIQARGIRDDQPPIASLVEAARHYGEIVAALQPRGALRLGGYSQGGALAYEVARQLEQNGRGIASLVLVDTPMPPVHSLLARDVHVVLTLLNLLDRAGLARSGDLRMLLEAAQAQADLVGFLIELGRSRGLRHAAGELRAMIEKYAAVAEANLACMAGYEPPPLADPSVECHYFARRDPHQFFAPELIVSEALRAQNEHHAASHCIERWRALLPALAVHTTGAADHFAMMEDPGSLAAIAGVCRRLYAARRETAGRTAPLEMLAGDAAR